VLNVLDVVLLGLVGAAVTGFIVLILYTQKVIIGAITYAMVFSLAVVLGLATWISQGI